MEFLSQKGCPLKLLIHIAQPKYVLLYILLPLYHAGMECYLFLLSVSLTIKRFWRVPAYLLHHVQCVWEDTDSTWSGDFNPSHGLKLAHSAEEVTKADSCALGGFIESPRGRSSRSLGWPWSASFKCVERVRSGEMSVLFLRLSGQNEQQEQLDISDSQESSPFPMKQWESGLDSLGSWPPSLYIPGHAPAKGQVSFGKGSTTSVERVRRKDFIGRPPRKWLQGHNNFKDWNLVQSQIKVICKHRLFSCLLEPAGSYCTSQLTASPFSSPEHAALWHWALLLSSCFGRCLVYGLLYFILFASHEFLSP